MQRYIIRKFSLFKKTDRFPTEQEIELIKQRLTNSEWQISDEFLSSSPAKQLHVTLQSLLDGSNPRFMEQLNILSNSENTINVNNLFTKNTNVPPGYSLAYCNPLSNESEISSDGYDNYHAPTLGHLEFFKRRMWVSGSFTYNLQNPLKFGAPLYFKETVNKIKFLERSNMIFADYRRLFSNNVGLCITESRGLCYIGDLFVEKGQSGTAVKEVPDKSVVVTPSTVTNFRMSAITFNSHQIHYNPEYSQKVEQYNNVIVEAPLLVSLALQFWCKNNPDKQIINFRYKITSPSYINEPLSLHYKLSGSTVRLWITNESFNTCFDSTIKI